MNIYIFSCINAYLGLFYHHPWYKCLNESKDVQIRLIYVPVLNGYLQFFLASPLQMQADMSLNSLGILFFTENPQRGKKALVLFESLLDENKRIEKGRGFSRSASNLYATVM